MTLIAVNFGITSWISVIYLRTADILVHLIWTLQTLCHYLNLMFLQAVLEKQRFASIKSLWRDLSRLREESGSITVSEESSLNLRNLPESGSGYVRPTHSFEAQVTADCPSMFNRNYIKGPSAQENHFSITITRHACASHLVFHE